jgi:hypothetical protein
MRMIIRWLSMALIFMLSICQTEATRATSLKGSIGDNPGTTRFLDAAAFSLPIL